MSAAVAKGREPNNSNGSAEMRCPTCGSPLSRPAFEAIMARLDSEEKARVEKVQREAQKAAEKQVRALRASQEEIISQRVASARETLAKEATEIINAEKVKAFAETSRLKQQLADMQRRLQPKPAHLIGEPAEISLHKALVAALPPEDKIKRVGRGVKGADFIITVMHGNPGVPTGKIIIDSKAHARWSNKFALKLKSDQREAGASFGILSSTVMPAGCAELHVQDGVIIANPLRVPALVLLLRQQILDSHRLALTTADRDEKADRLLSYIGSRECADLLDKVVKLTRDMADLDAKEASSHEAVWRLRAGLIRGLQAVNAEFLAEINRIIGGNDPEASP